MRNYLLLIFGVVSFTVNAQQVETSSVELKSVEVILADSEINEPVSVAKPPAPLFNMVSGLNLLQGVSSQEGAANTAKFAYRGFGARSQYTTSRTLFYIDDIPITGLQGFSTFEDINPVYLGSAEMHQPGTNFYPSALGGIVKLKTTDPNSRGKHEFKNRFTTGSFGLIGNTLLYTNEKQWMTVGYENLQRAGWRENSELRRQSIFFNSKRLFGKNLQLLIYGVNNRSEIPSSLTLHDVENNPEKAADSWGRIEGYEQYDRFITGLTWRNRKPNNAYSITAFYQYRNGFEPRPFNILDDESHHGGFRGTLERKVRGRLNGDFEIFAEYHVGSEDASTFENLYDSISNSHNNKGMQLNHTKLMSQLVNSGISWAGWFGDSSVFKQFGYQVALNSFYRYNQFESSIYSNYGSPLTLAPRFSLAYRPENWIRELELALYKANSIPSLEENLDPDGSLNAGLKPEEAWTLELGLAYGKRYRADRVNFYYSEVKNLIVPKVVGPEQVVATNAGSSQHAGVELNHGVYNYITLKDSDAGKRRNLSFLLNASGYYGYFAYKSFSDTTGSYSGNRLPGFPEWQGTLRGELSWKVYKWDPMVNLPFQEVTLGLQAQATGGHYINDQNTVRNEPFFLLQTWLGYQRVFVKHWEVEARAGIKNLTDTKYAGMTVVNNRAFGNAEPRYYYPGDPVNWFCSIAVAYRF